MSDLQKMPYGALGAWLKRMRVKRQETVIEVSGAVEIDADDLGLFERGLRRPTEDILLLLISHFGAKEDEATKLWELAGYDQNQLPAENMVNDQDGSNRQAAIVMPSDARVLYTDMVHVAVNNFGVVVNFMQGSGAQSQPMVVSRVGMSKDHAQSLLEVLQKTLAQSESKKIPPQSS